MARLAPPRVQVLHAYIMLYAPSEVHDREWGIQTAIRGHFDPTGIAILPESWDKSQITKKHTKKNNNKEDEEPLFLQV